MIIKKRTLLLALFISVVSFSCRVSLISSYDQQVADQITATSKLIDKLYLTMLDQDVAKRKYDNYSAAYINIEVELNAIVNRNKTKLKNADAQKVAENTVQLWTKYRLDHKIKDLLPDAAIKLNLIYMRDAMNDLQLSEDNKKIASSSNN